MKFIYFKLKIFLICIFYFNFVNAQKLDSVLLERSESFPQEKIHIQFDKPYYNVGDIVWYKSYILAGTEPSQLSGNLYVDFFGDDGKLLLHSINPINESGSKGQFQIPLGFKGGNIVVKAYTKWMLNFDKDFVFQKSLLVIQKSVKSSNSNSKETTINFFPEGGDMVEGIKSRIAFMANYSNGFPVSVNGTIYNQEGKAIETFTSEHDGMGSIEITPSSGEVYSAIWVDEFGNNHITNLPKQKTSGVILKVKTLAERDIIYIERSIKITDEFKTLHLIASMNQHPVFTANFNLNQKIATQAEIPTSSLPTGVLQITLFNSNWIPVAERVVFVNNREYEFKTKVKQLSLGQGKRELNELEISLSDKVQSNLSISVTDADVTEEPPFANNIFTQLLICSDIKGFVYRPGYYFSNDYDTISNHLDLVMLTHGWRKYKWDEMLKGKQPEIYYQKDTGDLSLMGQVKNMSKFKIDESGEKLSLIIQTKDSSQQIYSLKINKDGKLNQLINPFYDSAKLYYLFGNNQKLQDKGDLDIKTDYINKPLEYYSNQYVPVFANQIKSSSLDRSVFFITEDDKITKDKIAHQLEEIVVKANIKKREELLDKEYTSGLFRGDGQKIDVIKDPKVYYGITLAQYLTNKVPGLNVQYDSVGNPYFFWRGDKTDIYLDEVFIPQSVWDTSHVKMDLGTLKNVQVNDIAYIKVFQPGTSSGLSNSEHIGGSPGGAIALYSKLGGEVDLATSKFKIIELQGYTPYKEFYSPDYSLSPADFFKDARTTLYWNPEIFIKNDEKFKLKFYNNDYTKKFKIILEGISTEGLLTHNVIYFN